MGKSRANSFGPVIAPIPRLEAGPPYLRRFSRRAIPPRHTTTVGIGTAPVSELDIIMYAKLTIFQKGLLLFSIPLVLQAIFIGILVRLQTEVVEAQRWAVHTKEVIAKVEETTASCSKASPASATRPLRRSIGRRTRAATSSTGPRADRRASDARLGQSLAAGRGSRRSRQRSQAVLGLVRDPEDQPLSNQSRGRRRSSIEARDSWAKFARSSTKSWAPSRILDRDRMEALRRTSRRQFRATVGGGLSILATTSCPGPRVLPRCGQAPGDRFGTTPSGWRAEKR